jgi:hypothetical protein
MQGDAIDAVNLLTATGARLALTIDDLLNESVQLLRRQYAGRAEEPPVCPRCAHHIPTDEQPGLYSGAISRTDNRTEICSPCGSDEALKGVRPGDRKDGWAIKARFC